MSSWSMNYRSLYAYLTDWCDYTHSQAVAEVKRVMAEDGSALGGESSNRRSRIQDRMPPKDQMQRHDSPFARKAA